MKRKICLLMAFVLLLGTVFSLTSCSKPPEYTEIEARFRELVEASQEVNVLLFGEGLPTYERVYDPLSGVKVHTVPDPSDPENEEKITRFYYYELKDPTYGRVIAFRTSYLAPYSYLQLLSEKDESREVYYISPEQDTFGYVLENYTEPKYEFFYQTDDPMEYDYVRFDCEYATVSHIKELAQTVYSPEYLEAIYEWLFIGTTGVVESVDGLSARYIEYSDDDGQVYLMESNTFEPMVKEKRIYDYETAEIVKPSNKKYVNIEIDSHLESKPEEILRVRISMQLVNGVWMLDGPTY